MARDHRGTGDDKRQFRGSRLQKLLRLGFRRGVFGRIPDSHAGEITFMYDARSAQSTNMGRSDKQETLQPARPPEPMSERECADDVGVAHAPHGTKRSVGGQMQRVSDIVEPRIGHGVGVGDIASNHLATLEETLRVLRRDEAKK